MHHIVSMVHRPGIALANLCGSLSRSHVPSVRSVSGFQAVHLLPAFLLSQSNLNLELRNSGQTNLPFAPPCLSV